MCSKSRAANDTALHWTCIFYMEHNTRDKEQDGEFIGNMAGSKNAYGSAPHRLIQEAIKTFWFPEELENMLMQYYNWFSTSKFTT